MWVDRATLAHARLLAGQWDAARRLADAAGPLGWSGPDSPQAVVATACLARLSGKPPEALPPNLAQLWRDVVDQAGRFSYLDPAQPLALRLRQAYRELFAATDADQAPDDELLAWCVEAAMRRAVAIAEGQHRKSYGKAALVIGAAAEVLRLRGRPHDAAALFDELQARFPRRSALQAELATARQLADTAGG